MKFNPTLIYSEINPIFYLLAVWIGIFLFFGGISFLLWLKGNRMKSKLKKNPEVRFFENVEMHVHSKSKLSYNFSIPCKMTVAVKPDEIHFLPGKFNVFILTNLIPSSVNLKTNDLEIKPLYSKTIQLKFDSNSLRAFFKPLYLLRTNFECTLTCESEKQREELLLMVGHTVQ